MNNLKTLLFGCLFLFIAESCFQNRQRQVWLTELKEAHESDNADVVRIYLDKKGEIYPDNIYIPYKDFFQFNKNKNTFKLDRESGSLENYFSNSTDALNNLAGAYNIPANSAKPNLIFNKVEQLIIDQTENKIDQLLMKSSSKDLIILIHGFNDPNPSGDYQRMRNYIKAYKKLNDAVYLELFWDGLTANQGNPGTSKIWGFAQLNSAYESITIRKILNGIKSDAHIRIITHSLGASIGTGILFNTYHKWENPQNQDYYKQMISIPAPIQKDIRIGMIAPAIPGVETFIDFNKRSDLNNISIADNNISKVVVGFKESDYALRKGFFSEKKYLSKLFGATSLGCNAMTNGKGEIDRVQDQMYKLGYINPGQIIKKVDFNSDGTSYKDEHGLYYYMLNENSLKIFLDNLFD